MDDDTDVISAIIKVIITLSPPCVIRRAELSLDIETRHSGEREARKDTAKDKNYTMISRVLLVAV